MKLYVRSETAMLLGNGLIAHVRSVQDHLKKHGKPPARPYMTYTQLREQTGASLAMVGIGNFLGEIMEAIHAPDAPPAMRGLTLFVTPKEGLIDFSKAAGDWYGINKTNAPQFRKQVLEFDWTGVSFVVAT